jgi:hypothetical protein
MDNTHRIIDNKVDNQLYRTVGQDAIVKLKSDVIYWYYHETLNMAMWREMRQFISPTRRDLKTEFNG